MPSDNQKYGELELSIIIISYNTSYITMQTLHSIFQTYRPKNKNSFEIIVLDNASTDDSVNQIKDLQKLYPQLKLIQSSENLGFSKGNNKAVQSAQGTHLLFLNSDIVVQPQAIEQLLQSFKENDGAVHFAGGKLLNADGSPQPSCGRFFTLWVVFATLFLRGDYWGLTRSSPVYPKRVDWVSGACIMTKSIFFDELGGFDEQLFMYMEEVDLLYRARLVGYNTWIFPRAQFIHLGSASSGGKTYPILQVYRGLLYFYRKHYSLGSLRLLTNMLQWKARLALILGRLVGNAYLITTYEQAIEIARVAR